MGAKTALMLLLGLACAAQTGKLAQTRLHIYHLLAPNCA